LDFINLNHLKEMNETWGEHFLSTVKYSFIFLGLFFISLIHAVIPIIFTKTVSIKLKEIQHSILYRKYADEPGFIKLMKENVKREQ
tara:strand:+ start:157 stop:414 length:258 start_codon:yes stop_codon:yes gene_type:complete